MTSQPYCDRCGEDAVYTDLESREVGGERYWLCAECAQTIVDVWLLEHQTLIARQRRTRQRRRATSGQRIG